MPFQKRFPLFPQIIAIAACLFLVMAMSVTLHRRYHFETERILYLPYAPYLAMMDNSLKSGIADFFYIRMVLSLTDEFKDKNERLKYIQNTAAVSVTLDPRMVQSYFFAGVVIADDNESLRKGISFLTDYSYLAPDDWRLPYWIGVNYYQLGEYLKAAQFYQKAGQKPGAPNFLKTNPALFYYKSGETVAGIAYLEGLAGSVNDARQLELIERKLEWLRRIAFLEKNAGEFKQRFGRYPDELEDLVRAGLIGSIADDPFGVGFYWDKQEKRVKSRNRQPGKIFD
jgi:tetratricopeptide (TPR) repeat protein